LDGTMTAVQLVCQGSRHLVFMEPRLIVNAGLA